MCMCIKDSENMWYGVCNITFLFMHTLSLKGYMSNLLCREVRGRGGEEPFTRFQPDRTVQADPWCPKGYHILLDLGTLVARHCGSMWACQSALRHCEPTMWYPLCYPHSESDFVLILGGHLGSLPLNFLQISSHARFLLADFALYLSLS